MIKRVLNTKTKIIILTFYFFGFNLYAFPIEKNYINEIELTYEKNILGIKKCQTVLLMPEVHDEIAKILLNIDRRKEKVLMDVYETKLTIRIIYFDGEVEEYILGDLGFVHKRDEQQEYEYGLGQYIVLLKLFIDMNL